MQGIAKICSILVKFVLDLGAKKLREKALGRSGCRIELYKRRFLNKHLPAIVGWAKGSACAHRKER
jgi:hypothetical protein